MALSSRLRRGLGALLDDLEPFLGLEPPHRRGSAASSSIRDALLAIGHGKLALPSSTHFQRLAPVTSSISLTTHGERWLHSHDAMAIPRPSERGSSSSSTASSMLLHRFTLRRSTAAPLNKQLADLALRLERGGGGNSKTNQGGYQSADDLLDGPPGDPCCVTLHEIASAALDAVQMLADDGGEKPQQPPKQPSPRRRAAHAWLNVNRGGDYNEMHTHDPRRWSGVYFVSGATGDTTPVDAVASLQRDGGEEVEEEDNEDDELGGGRLVFRGGGHERGVHCYLPVPAEPGVLWLFPGGLPHCVTPVSSSDAGGVGETSTARISVAINFEEGEVRVRTRSASSSRGATAFFRRG